MSDLRKNIETAVNRASAENGSNTPDWILAHYLIDCLSAFDRATRRREKWYGRGSLLSVSELEQPEGKQ